MNIMKNIQDFIGFGVDLKKLATDAAQAFVESYGATATVDDGRGKDGIEAIRSLDNKSLAVLTKVGDKIKIKPYSMVIENDITMSVKNVIPFFSQAGQIYRKYAPNNHMKGNFPHDWGKASDEMQKLARIYSSEKLADIGNTGILTD